MSGSLKHWQIYLLRPVVIDNRDYSDIMTDMHRLMTEKTTEADLWQVRDFARYLAELTRFRL